jgi:hypothetical protein
VKAFDRQPPPAFWIDRVCRWVDLFAKGEEPAGNNLHDWSEQKRTLAEWFHDTVRPAGEGALCAYCDGLLGTQSPETIDHWIPRETCLALAGQDRQRCGGTGGGGRPWPRSRRWGTVKPPRSEGAAGRVRRW